MQRTGDSYGIAGRSNRPMERGRDTQLDPTSADASRAQFRYYLHLAGLEKCLNNVSISSPSRIPIQPTI